MNARKAALALIATGLLVGLVLSRTCEKKEPSSGAPEKVVEAPPQPAPEDLLATAIVTTPDSSWGKIQRGVGGSLGLVPSTLGGLVTALAGIDSALAPEIDGGSPVYFAVAGRPEDPSWVISVHLTDARHARALVAFDAGRFATKDVHGMIELVPRESMSNVFVAFDGDRLLVARREQDLDSLGAYASRALPKNPVPSVMAEANVPSSAIAHVGSELTKLWTGLASRFHAQEKDEREAHAGKEPDYADTKAVFSMADEFVSTAIARVSDFDSAKLTLDFAEDGAHVTLVLRPKDGAGPARSWIDAMATGDASALLTTTSDARAVALFRTSKESREKNATSFSETMQKAFGARLTDDDKKNISRVSAGIGEGAGNEIVATLPSAHDRAIAVRTKPASDDAAKDALGAFALLLQSKTFREPLKIQSVLTENKSTENGVKASVTTIAFAEKPREGKKPARVRPPSAIASAFDDGALVVAAGEDSLAVLSDVIRPARKISDDRVLAQPLEALGHDVTFALLLQPYKLEPSRLGKPPAPVIFTLGKREGSALGALYLSLGALSELAKLGAL